MTAPADDQDLLAKAAADPEGRRLVQAILDRKEAAEAEARWRQMQDVLDGGTQVLHTYVIPKDLKVGDTVQYLGVVAPH